MPEETLLNPGEVDGYDVFILLSYRPPTSTKHWDYEYEIDNYAVFVEKEEGKMLVTQIPEPTAVKVSKLVQATITEFMDGLEVVDQAAEAKEASDDANMRSKR